MVWEEKQLYVQMCHGLWNIVQWVFDGYASAKRDVFHQIDRESSTFVVIQTDCN